MCKAQPSLKILSHHILYRHPRFHAAFPSIATRSDGTCLVVFRRARNVHWLSWQASRQSLPGVDHLDARSALHSLQLRSDLSLLSQRHLPTTLDAADQDASLLALDNGDLLLAGFSWYPRPHGPLGGTDPETVDPGSKPVSDRLAQPTRTARRNRIPFIFWGGYTRRSTDGGESWSAHRYLPPLSGYPDIVPNSRPMLGGAVRGRGVDLGAGHLLQSTYIGSPRNGTYTSHLFRSRDHGRSWQLCGPIAADPAGVTGYAEPCLVRSADGRLFALHRSFGLGDRITVAVSDDLGAHWSPPASCDVVGHPCDVLPLTDTQTLLVYGYRHRPYGIRARIWAPDRGLPGETDSSGAEIILRDDGGSPDLGYPWATRLDRDHLLVVYYFCDIEGIRHIAATRLQIVGH